MILRVSHIDIVLFIHRNAFGMTQLTISIAHFSPLSQKCAVRCKFIDTMCSLIRYINRIHTVNRHTCEGDKFFFFTYNGFFSPFDDRDAI